LRLFGDVDPDGVQILHGIWKIDHLGKCHEV
jgi:hypothetical protein